MLQSSFNPPSGSSGREVKKHLVLQKENLSSIKEPSMSMKMLNEAFLSGQHTIEGGEHTPQITNWLSLWSEYNNTMSSSTKINSTRLYSAFLDSGLTVLVFLGQVNETVQNLIPVNEYKSDFLYTFEGCGSRDESEILLRISSYPYFIDSISSYPYFIDSISSTYLPPSIFIFYPPVSSSCTCCSYVMWFS